MYKKDLYTELRRIEERGRQRKQKNKATGFFGRNLFARCQKATKC